MDALIEDDRNKRGKHSRKHDGWDMMGVEVIRHRMEVGDYASVPAISVDTKASLVELCGNLRTDHERFRNECIRAKEIGTQLIVLTENKSGVRTLEDFAQWRESAASMRIRNGRQRYDGKTLAKVCHTMRERYGVMFDFCEPDEAAARVIELIERGEEWIWRRRLASSQAEE